MMHGNCKCGHHWVPKILAILVWVAGVAFFWSGFRGVAVWGYDPLFYAWSTVVLSLLAWSCNYCGCYGVSSRGGSDSGKMSDNVCSHEAGCKCGDCERCK